MGISAICQGQVAVAGWCSGNGSDNGLNIMDGYLYWGCDGIED